MRLILGLLACLLLAPPALAQGPGPGPGPGPVPSPWIVNGNTISYAGGILAPSSVTGGSKGPGTMNVSGGYYVQGVLVSGLPSIASANLICNRTGGTAVPTACSWNQFAGLAIGTTQNSFPFYSGGGWGTVGTGKSVLNPGSGALENVLQPQTVAGASKAFVAADLFLETRRSNAGSAMTDTFPPTGTAGLVNGTQVTYNNVDATATATITAGAGTTMSNGLGSETVGPGRSIQYVYDAPGTIWRRTLNTGTALLGPNNLSDLGNIATARANLIPAATITNTQLVNNTITINSQACTLGGACTISASAGAITVGTGGTIVTGGPGLLFNSTSGGLLSAVTTANNGVLVTNGAGVFSISSTLPASLAIPTPSITTPGITGGTHTGITSLGVRSTGSGAFDMTLANTENLTAGRTLTVTLNDTARTINLAGNLTFAGAFTTAGANGLTLTTTAFTNVTLPTTGTLATLAGSEALTNKTYNGNTLTSGNFTITGAAAKTLTFNNSLTLAGTDATTMTFPTTSATIARTDAAQTFTSGAQTFNGQINGNGGVVITNAGSNAFAVGLNGATNPAFVVDASTASQAAGLKVTGLGAGNGVGVAVIDSATNSPISLNAKGSGGIAIGNTSTGGVTITPAATFNSTINGLTVSGTGGGATLTIANAKTFAVNNSLTLVGTDGTTWTGPGVNATLASLNVANQTVTGGANVTTQALTTGSITANCGTRPLQSITGATSAWSITAPASDGSCFVILTNAASGAVVPTFSGFTVGSNTGAALTAVGSAIFTISIWRANGVSGYSIFAHQ